MDEKYFISGFISGLKVELKPMVRLMKPETLLDAVEIAQYQEQTVEIMFKKHEVKKSLVSINIKWTANDKKGETNVIAEKKERGFKENFRKLLQKNFNTGEITIYVTNVGRNIVWDISLKTNNTLLC